MAVRLSSVGNLWPRRAKTKVIGLFIAFSLLSGNIQASFALKQNSEEKKVGRTEPYSDPDGYQIYAILLNGGEGSSFVIQAETESWQKVTAKNLGIKGDSKFKKRWGTVLRDFAAKYRTPKLLSSSIPMTAAYKIVPADSLLEIFKREQGWTTFSQRYPLAHGFYVFSPVGFNGPRTRAVVWMMNSCGELCGYGTYHFFEKDSGRWHEVSVRAQVPTIVS